MHNHLQPTDTSVIPFQRLRSSFCLGSFAEPLAAFLSTAPPEASGEASRVEPEETVVGISSATTTSPILLASTHKRGVSRHTHRWSCYLRPVEEGEESIFFYSLIQSVTFKLDRTFNEPIRVVHEPPFAVTDVAWAEHHLEVVITFVEEAGLGPLLLHHTVILRERVAPEHCPIGLTASRIIANGEPMRYLVVPDVLTQASHPSCSAMRDEHLGDREDALVEAVLARSMLAGGGRLGGGGRLAVSERFDSVLVTHPRRRTSLFFETLAKDCRLVFSENHRPAGRSASSLSKGKFKPSSNTTSVETSLAALGCTRVQQLKASLDEAVAFALSDKHHQQWDIHLNVHRRGGDGGTVDEQEVPPRDESGDSAHFSEQALAAAARLLLLRIQHQVKLGYACRALAKSQSTTSLHYALEALNEEQKTSLDELETVDTQVARFQRKALHYLSRLRVRMKRMRGDDDAGVDDEAESLLLGRVPGSTPFDEASHSVVIVD